MNLRVGVGAAVALGRGFNTQPFVDTSILSQGTGKPEDAEVIPLKCHFFL